MREQSLNFLKTLVDTPSPVGHEVRGQRIWLEYVRQFADETFGLVYTSIVLQHIQCTYVERYLRELIRVLKPGGIFVFQVPDRKSVV